MIYERLIWLVPAAVAVFGTFRPRAGLLILAAALPFFGSPPGGPYLAALDVAGIAAILTAWRGGRAESSPLSWPAAAFVAVSLFSLIPSPYQPPNWQPSILLELLRAFPAVETWSALYTWRAGADLLLGWGLFWAARRAFAGHSPAPLAWAFLAGLSAVMTLGIAQAGGLVDLGGFRPHHGTGRLYSVFFLSGWLAEYLVMAAPPALAALSAAAGWGRRAVLPLAAVTFACLGLTQQRGAWIAAMIQLVAWVVLLVVLRRGRSLGLTPVLVRATAALALTTVVIAVAGVPVKPVLERARSLESGFSARLPVWGSATELARQRPLLGWGLGSFSPAYDLLEPRYSVEASPYRNTAHSLYLDVVAERGILGLVALGLLFWSAFACLSKPRTGAERLAIGLAVSLVGALAYGLVQYLFHLRTIAWLFWILLAAVALASRSPETTRNTLPARALLIAALLVMSIRTFLLPPPDYAGNRSFGFHEVEARSSGWVTWASGFAARRIPWEGETLILEMANGHPKGDARPLDVEIKIDGESAARVQPRPFWHEHAIELGAPSKQHVVLSIRARPTFRPFRDLEQSPDREPASDIRLLGVALKDIRWQ